MAINPTVCLPQIASLQSEHEEQEQRICQFEEELVQAREELLALQEESRMLQEKVQAAQEQLTPLQESVHDSFVQVAQVGLVGPDHEHSQNVVRVVLQRLSDFFDFFLSFFSFLLNYIFFACHSSSVFFFFRFSRN